MSNVLLCFERYKEGRRVAMRLQRFCIDMVLERNGTVRGAAAAFSGATTEARSEPPERHVLNAG